MKKIVLLIAATSSTLAFQANADWFTRGTHNAWVADEMENIGNNTMLADDVVFTANGSLKFDRFGDWTENYGVGGQGGGDIAVTAGTWDIEFYTDTKNWAILPSTTHNNNNVSGYHFRGTPNAWAEGTLLTQVGTTDKYEICVEFSTNADGGPRFKIDKNGAWGADAFPAADILIATPGFAKIIVDSTNDTVESVTEGLAANCGPVVNPGTSYHFRGTPNAWAEGTLLTQVAGTNDYEICLNFSANADGGPRFKIDKDGAWGADAFPAADITVDPGFAKIIVDSTNDTVKSVTDGLSQDCGPVIVQDDFRNRTMYFVFLDRFANGDTSNDNGNNAAATSTTGGGDVTEWKKYWGGDIQGLINKLDYLQNLGITAIWVTPLNNNVDNTGDAGAYHGYWGNDFYEVDEHLGDWDLVDQLDAAMEARGMKLVLDIALNHSNQDDQYEFGALYKEGVFQANEANTQWYHQNGAISDCGDTDPSTTCGGEWDDAWSFRNKSLFNLTDFNHGVNSNSVADTYLIDAAKKWAAHGVDAFRIDAIKHIEPNFINRFTAEMRSVDPDVYIFGEWYGAGASDALSMSFLNENRGSELLDFNLRDNIENAIADNSSMITLNAHINSRAGAMNNREGWQPIFLDNHDATRTSVYLQTTGVVNSDRPGKGFSKAFADARQNLGMALVMTLPGIPTVYYGTEQNSTWFDANGDGQIGHDPYNRESMPSFSETTPAFTLISALANLRTNGDALASGTYEEKWVNADILVFERKLGNETVVVAVNKGAATSITASALNLADGSYTSVIGSDIVTVTAGQAVFNLAQNEVIVLH